MVAQGRMVAFGADARTGSVIRFAPNDQTGAAR